MGVPLDKIELHHHSIDGKESELFMDWACTEAYCQAFADALGLKIYFSWKVGGFEAELLRDEVSTNAIAFEDNNKDIIVSGGTSNSVGTRLKFPAPVASLQTRWCSAYLKVDVGDRLIRKQLRFADGRNYLVIGGERAEESPARAKYEIYEKQFNHTIHMDGKSFIDTLADKGTVYDIEDGYFEIANSREYNESIIVSGWQYPSGAFGENCGAI